MTDEIDEYRGREFDWAVETVIENAHEMGLPDKKKDAATLVDAVWNFIWETFEETGLTPPDRGKVIAAVKAHLT